MKYISFIPSAFLIIPATEPFLVELNKSKNSSHYFAKQFNASFFITMLLGLPISLVMYLHHDLVTSVILGPNWLEYSNLLGIFGLLIPALIMFHQASRVLILFGKTKHLFIYECITFVILYSTLLFVGIKDLLLFSYVRVGMENLICSAFLTYVLLKYTSVGNTLSLILGFIPFGISAYIAYSLSSLVSVENLHDFFQLCIVTAAFFSAFYGSMLLFHLVFLRKLQEWMYLEQLVLRVCSPVISRLK
jgi:O-antigen/teichoic acid export membrane protein